MDGEEFVPLEDRKVQVSVNGIGRFIPALHSEWAAPREWIAYTRAPEPGQVLAVPGAKETWMERCGLVIDDLKALLSSPYHVFWSQVTFDRGLHKHLGRLLKRLPRAHDRYPDTPDEFIKASVATVMTLSFHVFLRMSTHKESRIDFMRPEFFAKQVYNKYLFDVPRILDICSLYLVGNHSLVEKMIANLLNNQPRYLDDLKGSVPTILQAFATTTEHTEDFIYSRTVEGASAVAQLEDLVLYATDLAVSLSSLFGACSSVTAAFQDKNREFTIKMATFYHHCLFATHTYVAKQLDLENLDVSSAEFLQSRIMLAKHHILSAVRITMDTCFVNPVMDGTKIGADLLEELLHLFGGFLSESSFYMDYISSFPIDDDLDIFRQRGIEVDAMRVDYLRDGIRKAYASARSQNDEQPQGATALVEGIKAVSEAGTIVSRVALESLVSSVRDLFPQLGEGFLAECLPYFDNDPEKVINALLEDNLPPHLASLDRTMPAKKDVILDDPDPEPAPAKPVQDGRSNVYDGDDFDIAYNDNIDLSRVHRGKKRHAKNANAMLDDKTDLIGMKERFAALSIITDDVLIGPGDLEYDDEYDDTYDENALGEKEPDALDGEREFVLPRALGGGHVNSRRQKYNEDDDDDDDDEGVNQRPKFDFARNPEEIRAEAERKRQIKQQARTKKVQSQPPHRDVVGKPKGQGQDKQVLKNRDRKTTSKNKHHRAMADNKNSKGMF
jgi:activating signal cointegrator complex subunit 2